MIREFFRNDWVFWVSMVGLVGLWIWSMDSVTDVAAGLVGLSAGIVFGLIRS